MAKNGITDTDYGYRRMMAEISRSRGMHVVAGIPESKNEPHRSGKGPSLVQVAVWNEMGLGVPRRSFIADTIDARQKRYVKAAKKLAPRVLLGEMPPAQLLDLVGQIMVGDMKKRIASGIPPANARETIRRKKSSKPLIHTGHLRTSITHEVRR